STLTGGVVAAPGPLEHRRRRDDERPDHRGWRRSGRRPAPYHSSSAAPPITTHTITKLSSISGQMKRRYLSYPTLAIARPPTTTTFVGAISMVRPWPIWKAVITSERLTPAKSPSGASSGIASVACPDEDGIRIASGMLTIITSTAKIPADAPLTSSSIALSTVSRV